MAGYRNHDDDGPYYRPDRYRAYDDDGYNGARGPITHRIGSGRRARIAVETGGSYAPTRGVDRRFQLETRREEAELRRKDAAFDIDRRRGGGGRSNFHEGPSRSQYRGDSQRFDDDAEILEPYPPAEPRIGRPHSTSAPSTISQYEGDDENQPYGFELPAKPQPVTEAVTYDYVEDVSFPLDAADSSEGPGKGSLGSKSKFNGAVTELQISKSRWLGSAYDRGDLSAEVSVNAAAGTQTEKPQEPLMRWYHLERPVMSLEEFIAAAQNLLHMTEKKSRDVNRLLRDMQRKYERQRQHGRDLEPNCISDVFVGENTGKQTDSVEFLSFPYFCLEPYNSPSFKNMTQGTPMHPLRPLLQAHFHSTSQKRELAQAITTFPNTGDSNCVQLSQMWCLLVDGDTILTCARQSFDALSGEAIAKSETPSTEDGARIKVSVDNNRSWLIPVNDQTSMPAFLSVFGESLVSLEGDGATARLEVNGAPVNAGEWSFVVGAAQTGSVGLDLQQMDLQKAGKIDLTGVLPLRRDQPPVSGTRSPGGDTQHGLSAEEQPSMPKVEQPTVEFIDPSTAAEDNDALEIFKYTSEPTLEVLAATLHFTLQNNPRSKEKTAYERTGEAKVAAVAASLQANVYSSKDLKIDLARIAIYLFRFFWPLNTDHPVAGKYWAAVERALAHSSETFQSADVDGFMKQLSNDVVPLMDAFAREFSESKEDLQPLPDAFSKAFLHLLVAFVLLSRTTKRQGFGINNSTVRNHISCARDQLDNGKREITARLKAQTPELEDLEICSPASLLALVLNQLSQDVMHGKPDVANTYNDYFFQLDFRITEDPTSRSHQESLRFFLQEVEAILSTLQYQRGVLEGLEEGLWQQSSAASSSRRQGKLRNNYFLRETLGESRQQLVLDSCKARIAARIDKFRGLQQRAQDLGEWHRNEMETNRDRQENAIMVFTIVTIIFLPLSFVTSFFGMNTADVRDMEYGQWAYWAAGLPLTVLVVVGSLWWAGEFEGFGSWVERMLRRGSSATSSGRSGWSRIPEPVAYGRRGQEEQEENRRLVSRSRARYDREEVSPPRPKRRVPRRDPPYYYR